MTFENYINLEYYNKTFYLLEKAFIGKLIKKGKKLYALKIFNDFKYLLKKKTKKNPNLIIIIGVLNSLIKVHFIKKRFGGIKKDIPVPLTFERQVKFAVRELLYIVKTKRMKSINLKKLVNIICYCYKFKGPIIKKNFQLYKKAMVNRVLLNFIKK
jgi:ribosomal protein S7